MPYLGHVLTLGVKDPVGVKALKTQLNALGYGPLDPENPVFGEATALQVVKFQKLNQLHPDAIVGELTWARLFNPRVNKPVTSKILRYRALEIANTQLFVREKTGKNDGAEVKSYLKSVGLSEGYAWCQAFIYWSFQQAALDLGVKNPVPRTAGVLECLRQAKANGATIIHDNPQEGDQFIMDFGGGFGHTGLVEVPMGESFYSVEGNTNDGGSRDGDGTYERKRLVRTVKAFIRYE